MSKYDFNHTIRFIAFSGEEQGCFGSFYDAKQSYKRDENIIAVLNIDGVGFVNTSEDGKIVKMNTQDRSKWIVDFTNDIAEKYNVPPSAIAIAWILRHPAKILPLAGTTKPDRLKDICKASSVTLSRKEWYNLYQSAGNNLP